MQHQARQRLVLVLVLALGTVLASSEALRQPERTHSDGSRHRRALLAAAQQISQCNWIQGEGCALHPAYASYALNRTSDDVVAQYAASALACATATDKGLCESYGACAWDPSFSNGQQGCFLQEDSLLSLQLRCVQPQYQASLSKLQSCMAARHSCQCSSSGSGSRAACTQRQQQLQASFPSSSRDRVCGSLLGCWLSNLNGSSPDMMQLVETYLLVVQPKIESLSSSASSANSTTAGAASGTAASGTASGRRRALLQIPPSLSDPVLDDKSSSSGGSYTPESGSYGSGSSSGSVAGTPSVGMNGVITDDQTAASIPTSTTPVENGNNIPAPSRTNSSSSGSSSNGSIGLSLESGSVGSDWLLEQGTLDPDKVFGSGSSGSNAGSSGSSSGGSGSSGSSSDGSVQMTGGNAPASFWQCAASAAAKADTTRKWADVDYNSRTLTLAIWTKVIQPTSLIDWGIQVLECFKTEVPKLAGLDASTNSTKPNKESLEYAIVTLIRAFTGQADAFRAYLQAGPSARNSAALTALSKLTSDVFPAQLSALAAKQQSAAAYRRDVMLQAGAIMTDMQWFAADVLTLARSAGASSGSAAQQEALEGYITYSEETMRRVLFWFFHITFDGAPAHLPGAVPSSAASTAVLAAFEGLAATVLPSRAVAADAPAWQQIQVMTATAAGAAAAAAASGGSDFDASQLLGNTVAALARAHVQDLWGSRLELARNGASEAARQLALRDPNEKSAHWEPLRKQQVLMLAALQQRAALGRNAGDAANLGLARSLQELVAATGAYLLSSGSNGTAAQQQKQQELSSALGQAAKVALLVRQCYGSPAGLPAMSQAAAAAAGVPAAATEACAQLSSITERLAELGQGGVVSSTLLADIDRQWRCASLPTDSCSSRPGCALALAPVLVPAAPASSSDSALLSCQAADTHLFLSSLDSSDKSALASGQTCGQFLQLPSCEAISDAASCSGQQACRWERSAQRNVLHTAPQGSKAAATAAAAATGSTAGACSMDWVSVLSTTGSGSSFSTLNSMVQLCSSIQDSGQCESQTMLIALDTPAPSNNSSMARIWVPALVVAGVAGVLLFGAAMWWRRRSAAARRAAEEAAAAAGGGRGSRRGGKDGKGGKGAKGSKKKPKRAEPGSYKPDLMRDSFTDYMRSAPQQFENGVAIAKAAMATGDLDTAVAVADVAGARSMSPTGSNAGNMGPLARSPSPQESWGLGVGRPGSGQLAPGSQSSSDLIDLSQSSEASAHNGPLSSSPSSATGLVSGVGSSSLYPSSVTASQQQQQVVPQLPLGIPPAGPAAAASSGGGSSISPGGGSSSIWGSALAGSGFGAATAPGLVSPRGLGLGQQQGGLMGRPPLAGDMSVPVNLLDANASLALTSSINLVSSLPAHSSVPVGLLAEQQQQQHQVAHDMQQLGLLGVTTLPTGVTAGVPPSVTTGGGAARVTFGASNSLARISSSNLGSRGFDSAHSGSLLLPAASRGGPGSEDGEACVTPASSCCHDSVCTFGPGPGSVVSTSSGNRGMHGHRVAAAGAAAGGRGSGASAAAAAAGLNGAPSVPLSRSSWSSAVSTELLMSTQNSSAVLDP